MQLQLPSRLVARVFCSPIPVRDPRACKHGGSVRRRCFCSPASPGQTPYYAAPSSGPHFRPEPSFPSARPPSLFLSPLLVPSWMLKASNLVLATFVVALSSLALPRLLSLAQHLRARPPARLQHSMAIPWKNVVVVGGSFVGLATAKELAEPGALPEGYRVVVVEKHSRELGEGGPGQGGHTLGASSLQGGCSLLTFLCFWPLPRACCRLSPPVRVATVRNRARARAQGLRSFLAHVPRRLAAQGRPGPCALARLAHAAPPRPRSLA